MRTGVPLGIGYGLASMTNHLSTKIQCNFTHLQLTIDYKDKMCKIMLFVLLFSCCFAQEEKILDHDDNIIPGAEIVDLSSEENPPPQEGNSVGEILKKLGAELNKDLRKTMSVLLADMADMKEKMEEMADTKVMLEQTRE